MRQTGEENLYQRLLAQLKEREWAAVITVLGKEGQIEKRLYEPETEQEEIEALVCEAYREGRPAYRKIAAEKAGVSGENVGEKDERLIFVEPFTRKSRMILLGGGHVSLALEEFAARTGFSVTVADDRPAFANRARFPLAETVLCESFDKAIEKLDIHASDFIVLLTRGHRHDGACLRILAEQEKTVYLGMIGSRKRVRELKEQLAEEGISREWLDAIHTPVGLDIGAVTPEEIAVAILAEIIMVKRKPSVETGRRVLQSDVDMEVISHLAQMPERMQGMKRAIVTVMETKGSTPRKAGAKMIVYENGMIQGTIGGGCAEAELMRHAREIMRNGGYKICHADMTGTAAEEEGMVCGGTMQALIEAV